MARKDCLGVPSSPNWKTWSSRSEMFSRKKCLPRHSNAKPNVPRSGRSRFGDVPAAKGRSKTSRTPSPVTCRRGPGKPNGMSRIVTAATVGRLFFPQSQSLGLDRGEYSVALLDKIVYAGVTNTSFAQGSQDLSKLAEVDVSAKQVERVCQRIGAERLAQRNAAVAQYQALPLTQRKEVPAGVLAPELAVVGCDGGRLQILERTGAPVEAEAAADAEDGRRGKHWREDKIGLLQTMHSEVAASDPCPVIPEAFIDPTRILKLARELKKQALPSEEAVQETPEPEMGAETLAENRQGYEPPEVEEKRFVASRVRWPDFGPLLATAAWAWGFFGAPRQVFLGDGSDNNWTIWRQHFRRLRRSWISSMPCRMYSRRRWRAGPSRPAGRSMSNGLAGSGAGRWPR